MTFSDSGAVDRVNAGYAAPASVFRVQSADKQTAGNPAGAGQPPSGRPAVGRTLDELAARIGVGRDRLAALLREDEVRGLVEFRGGRWRLTTPAEQEFGQALRWLGEPERDQQ